MKYVRPAILYKEEITKRCMEMYHSQEYFYYMGCVAIAPIHIVESDDYGETYQYAIVNDKEELVGYIAYKLRLFERQADSFGLISFNKDQNLIGFAAREILDEVINKHKVHRIEFRCVGGNPVKRHYDALMKHLGGHCVVLHDAIRDAYGNYHDDIIYEVLFDN